jgi:hypothetical protein
MVDVVPSIVRMLNRSFETAYVPANMKKSRIIPVFKYSDRTDPNNYTYRPNFVIPLVSKIMEKIVFKRLTVFIVCFRAEWICFKFGYGLCYF